MDHNEEPKSDTVPAASGTTPSKPPALIITAEEAGMAPSTTAADAAQDDPSAARAFRYVPRILYEGVEDLQAVVREAEEFCASRSTPIKLGEIGRSFDRADLPCRIVQTIQGRIQIEFAMTKDSLGKPMFKSLMELECPWSTVGWRILMHLMNKFVPGTEVEQSKEYLEDDTQ